MNSLDEGVWSKSALDKFNRKPMPGRYFISDEKGNILEKGLKTLVLGLHTYTDSVRLVMVT